MTASWRRWQWHRRTGQPVDNDDNYKEGKDARANWCNEDASDDDNKMAPHFRFEQLWLYVELQSFKTEVQPSYFFDFFWLL